MGKGGRFFLVTARGLMLLAGSGLVLSYLSLLVNPAGFWFLTIFGLLYLPFLALNFFLLFWALIRHSKAFWIPLVALVPSVFVLGWHVQAGGNDAEISDDDVRIVSYNVGLFRLGEDADDDSRDSVFAYLDASGADIICLQEVAFKDAAELERTLRGRFPAYDLEYYVRTGGPSVFGNVILSRFPALEKGRVSFEESSNMALYADYYIDGMKVRVYNCHFQSYNISLSGIGRALRRGASDALKDTERKMSFSLSLRPRQVDAVMRNIESCSLPSIVAGDFNDTPMSYTYRRLRRDRTDTFVAAGEGFGASYSILRPFLRIDYVLLPGGFEAVTHKVRSDLHYSDHFPVEASFHKL